MAGSVSTASSFRTDLSEMESALRMVGGLIAENFGDPARAPAPQPLSRLPFQRGAASNLRQSGSAALERSAETEADDGAGTFYGLDFQEAAALDYAHGTLLESLLKLRSSIEQGIQALRQNLRTTHQMYCAAEDQIKLTVTNLVPAAVTQTPLS